MIKIGRSLFSGALAIALLSTAGNVLAAQQASRTINVGVAGGVAFPIGDFADEADLENGFTVLGYLGWQPQFQPFGIRGEISYSKFGVDTFFGDGDVTKFGGAANVILTVSNDGNFRPYVIGGAGVYNVKEEFDASIVQFETENQTKLGLNGGVGAKFRLGGLNGTLEARYISVFLDGDRNMNIIPITLGLEF